MKTIQCAHPPHHHNGFVATCRLWTASGGVHVLLALEPIECSTSTRLVIYIRRLYICMYISHLKPQKFAMCIN